jgi:hypothetical protein
MVRNARQDRIFGKNAKARRERARRAFTPDQVAATKANDVARSLLRVSRMTPHEKLAEDARAAAKEAETAAATAQDVARMQRNALYHHDGRFSCCRKAITSYSGPVFAIGPNSATIVCGECYCR